MEEIQENKKKRVSFSQYAMYLRCPNAWKLNYLEGKRIFDANLNTCFGTAIHFTIQTYIEKLYKESPEVADSLNLHKIFQDKFLEELNTAKTKNPNLKYTDDDYTEFLFNGEDILKAFLNTSTRIKHFPSNKYEFIGTELPLDAEMKNNVDFIAFVDLILKEKATGKIKIYDFKTSFLGWKTEKDDPAKYEQVLIYKAVYSKKFKVPLNMIDVEFFILKRKLYENVSFPQSHIQLFTPSHNSPSIASAINGFSKFVSECFNEDGSFNIKGNYPKIPGPRKKNCSYCKHKNINCNAKPDKLIS